MGCSAERRPVEGEEGRAIDAEEADGAVAGAGAEEEEEEEGDAIDRAGRGRTVEVGDVTGIGGGGAGEEAGAVGGEVKMARARFGEEGFFSLSEADSLAFSRSASSI